MNKKTVYIVMIVIALIAFYGGMVYGKSKTPAVNQTAQTFGQNTGGNRGGRGGTGFGGFTTGEIIGKDDKSITVKLMDGGSKIIFLDNNTKIAKTATGSLTDLATGTQVSIMGATNTDGSINAETVQIRPLRTQNKQ